MLLGPRCAPASHAMATATARGCLQLPEPGPLLQRLGQPGLQLGNHNARPSPVTALFIFPNSGRRTGQRGTDQPQGDLHVRTKGEVWTNGSPRPPFFIPETPDSWKWLLKTTLSRSSADDEPQLPAGPPRHLPPADQHAPGAKRPGACSLRLPCNEGGPRQGDGRGRSKDRDAAGPPPGGENHRFQAD